jgi:pimeloyl-ACP methyl ester carboxylesterase
MPTAHVNGTRLYYEITGNGFPLVFIHEFAGDYRSWEPQVRFFSRRYRVVVYNSRGYPPSDVPTDPNAYSESILVEDLSQLLTALEIPKAHVVGLSMGGGVALNFGLDHADRCASLVVASAGSGSTNAAQFKQDGMAIVERIEKEGLAAVQDHFTLSPARTTFREKDPRGWEEFRRQFSEHSAAGSALTFRKVQLERRSIFDLEARLKGLQTPTLLFVGDRDEACLEPALFMRRCIPRAGLLVLPWSGHAINLEEPDTFNRAVLDFLFAVEAGGPGMTPQQPSV